MEPVYLTPDQWNQIGTAITAVVFFVLAMVVAALSFLLSQAIVPSLAYTEEVPGRIDRLRPVLYGLMFIALIVAAYQAYTALTQASEILRIYYPRFFI